MNKKTDTTDSKDIAGQVAGGAVGAGVGMAGSIATISAAGTTAGLSGAGIASGLAAIGGGSMLGGIVVASGGVALFAIGGVFLARKLMNK